MLAHITDWNVEESVPRIALSEWFLDRHRNRCTGRMRSDRSTLVAIRHWKHVLSKERVVHRSDGLRSGREQVVLTVCMYSHRGFDLVKQAVESAVETVSTLEATKAEMVLKKTPM